MIIVVLPRFVIKFNTIYLGVFLMLKLRLENYSYRLALLKLSIDFIGYNILLNFFISKYALKFVQRRFTYAILMLIQFFSSRCESVPRTLRICRMISEQVLCRFQRSKINRIWSLEGGKGEIFISTASMRIVVRSYSIWNVVITIFRTLYRVTRVTTDICWNRYSPG